MALTKITNDLLDLGSDTGALGLPKGTEAQRPSNPVEGTLRHNSEIDETKLETFDGNDWRKINKIVDTTPYSVDWLVVAGGGGVGSYYYQGGGGAGGLRTSYGAISGGGSAAENSKQLIFGTSYTITIGAGGVGGTSGFTPGANGNDTSFDTITSVGGGKEGTDGGSGGGSGPDYNNGSSNYGQGTIGQGYRGGNGNDTSTDDGSAGGGGGAGQIGGAAPDRFNGGTGGDGLEISITGTPTYYAGGGGGAGHAYGNSDTNFGGLGGGGRGSRNFSSGIQATPGEANTGGGGGGGTWPDTYTGKPGGSGVVILRMPTSRYSGKTTGSPTVSTDGADTILTYTSSGTYTA